MDVETKKKAFEFLLTQMLHWGAEMSPVAPIHTFTRLKALKLLFFAAAVKNEQGCDLLDVFDNFYALPNGPVESDIYNSITSDDLMFYSFSDFYLKGKQVYNDFVLDCVIKDRITSAVNSLRMRNERIIFYKAEELVALSHSWASWQNSIQIARALGKGSYKMEVGNIRANIQIFVI